MSYFGAIIGAICTVIGVFFSIQYAQKSYKEDIKKRVLPYMVITPLRWNVMYDPFEDLQDINSKQNELHGNYNEYELKKVFIVIENGEALLKESLSKEQQSLLHSRGIKKESIAKGVECFIHCPLNTQPMIIENVGNGTAVHFTVRVSNKNGEIEKSMIPINLNVSQSFGLHLYCNNYEMGDKNCGVYQLELCYDNIYGNSYMQKYDFEIGIDTEKGKYFMKFSVEGKQEELKG